MKTSFLFSVLATAKLTLGAYKVQDDYTADKWWDMFDMFTDADPTQGFVKYVDYNTAMNAGMITTGNNTVRMAAESKTNAPGGRQSLRITSKAAYNSGLIVLDLAHMPGSICGSWPAFWTVGPDWPGNGEIDIIEGVNTNNQNQMTLHTSQNPYCGISGNDFSGKVSSTNCFVNAAGQPNNAGCAIQATADATYGDDFNAAGGGVYATHWTDTAIAIYHFSRGSIPADIASGAPNPAGWGQPAAQWSSNSCNIGASFKNHNIVFDLTFCGAWAGDVWSSNGACTAKAGTCNDYVANNPAAFEDAYWIVNSLKVYQDDGTAAPAVPASSVAASSAAPAATSAAPAVSSAASSAATTAAPSAVSSAAAASGSAAESVITVTITETTMLSIPFPTSSSSSSSSSGGAQLLSGILSGTATVTPTAAVEMLAESEASAAAVDQGPNPSILSRLRRHEHHNRGLHHHHMH